MSKLEIKLVKDGMHALLNSQGASDACQSLANDLAGRCGADYAAAAPHRTGQRVAVNVYPASKEAAQDNADNDTLRRTVQSMEIVI